MAPSNVNGHTSSSFTSNSSKDTYNVQNSNIQLSKPRDIEEEDYIYKVPCDPRQTISLRDSVKVQK
jgi:hypothetical protein